MTSRPASIGSGLVVVDKPVGMTSHDVVGRLRRLARTRKVGHAGTLDPMATGMLVLGVDKATRLLGHLALTDKSYDATVRLGAATNTDDAEGDVLSTAPADRLSAVDEEEVRTILADMVGEIEQVPSAVSAVKVGGQRAYKRVRAGEQVRLPARTVTIHAIDVAGVVRRDGFVDVELAVRCSTGTYVRAIARDLGAALGVGGHLSSLRRTEVGAVSLTEATPLAELEAAESVPLMSMADAAKRFFPTVHVGPDGAREVGFGRPLPLELSDAGPVAVLGQDGSFLALYERAAVQAARPVAVFV